MALTTAQIESLLQQARSSGVAHDMLEALRWYLTDRAANLDGAGRLDLAQQMSTVTEADITDEFLRTAGAIRGEIMQRGRASVMAITDEEWQQITGGYDSESAKANV